MNNIITYHSLLDIDLGQSRERADESLLQHTRRDTEESQHVYTNI